MITENELIQILYKLYEYDKHAALNFLKIAIKRSLDRVIGSRGAERVQIQRINSKLLSLMREFERNL